MNDFFKAYECIAEIEKCLADKNIGPIKRQYLEYVLKIHREIVVGREKLDEQHLIFDAIDFDPKRRKRLKKDMDKIFYKLINNYFSAMMANDPKKESLYKNMLQDAVKEYEHVTCLAKK